MHTKIIFYALHAVPDQVMGVHFSCESSKGTGFGCGILLWSRPASSLPITHYQIHYWRHGIFEHFTLRAELAVTSNERFTTRDLYQAVICAASPIGRGLCSTMTTNGSKFCHLCICDCWIFISYMCLLITNFFILYKL